jgi:hypothetical protein
MGVETSSGSVYSPIGGGYMSDGRSSNAVQCAFTLMNIASDWKKLCQAKPDQIRRQIRQHARNSAADVHLSFVLQPLEFGVDYKVVDTLSGVQIGDGGRVQLPSYERR